MPDNHLITQEFERHRPRLRAVAYRMLGSITDADDAVQDAWLRLNRADADAIANIPGWLTTVIARVCLDMLRVRHARREEYIGSRLPEPLVREEAGSDPEYEALLADSVGLALLVVLDALAPPERLAYVLHDMFAVPFDEIAAILATTPTAARQLASRARRRIRGAAPAPDGDPAQHRALVDAFLAASRSGDFDTLVAILDPDAVFRVDAGGRGALARDPVTGAAAVARQILARGRPFARYARPAIVNGGAGVVVAPGRVPIAVAAFTVSRGRIAAIDLILDPEKLRRLEG
jgi:RNA polymerase sigma-70 factor (ECF subfamily)